MDRARSITDGLQNSHHVADGTAYLWSPTGWVYAINAQSGQVRWRHRTTDFTGYRRNRVLLMAELITWANVLDALAMDQVVHRLDRASGKEIDRLLLPEPVLNPRSCRARPVCSSPVPGRRCPAGRLNNEPRTSQTRTQSLSLSEALIIVPGRFPRSDPVGAASRRDGAGRAAAAFEVTAAPHRGGTPLPRGTFIFRGGLMFLPWPLAGPGPRRRDVDR